MPTVLLRRRRVLAALTMAIALAAGAVVFGAKLRLIHTYGSDVPYMDEWDAEARELFIPRALDQLQPLDFAQPHNEHRVALTRLINYALAVGNGQWDALLEMTINAAIHAGLAVALLLLARRLVGGARLAAIVLVVLALFTLPFDWENTLEGFQSQFYLLAGCALALFWLCLPAALLSPRWWAGWVVGLIGLGTMSSGFVAPATLIGVMVLQAAVRRTWCRRETAAVAALAVLCVAGLLMVTHVSGHDRFKAHNPREWLWAMATALSWPTLRWPLAFLILQAPMAVLIAQRVRRRELRADETVLIALAGWSWLQVTALAYGRANFGMLTSPRYMDMYAIGSVTNAIAFALLLRRGGRRLFWGAAAIAWIALFVFGLRSETRRAYEDFLDGFPRLKASERSHLREFLVAEDPAALRRAPLEELPYPNPDILGRLLDGPGVRALLPLSIRAPVKLAPAAESNGFVRTEADPAGAVARPTWIARRGPARFVSEPLALGRLPLLHLEIAGSVGLSGAVLRLQSPDGSESAAPAPRFGDAWQAMDLPVPSGSPVRLVVDLPPGEHWLAFTDPVELGRASWLTHWLLHRADAWARIAGLMFGAALIALLALDRGREDGPAAAA
jgi:hypothetical protein